MTKMFVKLVLTTMLGLVFCEKSCYWNKKCPYDLFASKTPYDSVRGDLRDYRIDCEPISVWSLHRHGNRNPSSQITEEIKVLKDKILREFVGNRWTNCAQDIEDLKNWSWNSTLENSTNFLTGFGYEELFELGRRFRNKYVQFDNENNVYCRATNEQRTVASAYAFVHGLHHGNPYANFTMNIDESLEQDHKIRPYEICEKYQDEVKNSPMLVDELAAYDSSTEFLAVRDRVQAKLDIDYQLTAADVYTLYELCRFERSWSQKLRSPWCSFFTDQDLVVLEYRDDVRHYYRNGYGSPINSKLGAVPLKELYENFFNAVQDRKEKTIVSYFTHDTMLEMVFCALGLYKDQEQLRGSVRNPSRRWRTSEIAAFATNFIAVLYRCKEPEDPTHIVQLLINEKPTSLCPEEICTWQQFLDIFQIFDKANLDFCTERSHSEFVSSSSGRSNTTLLYRLIITFLSFHLHNKLINMLSK